MDILKQRKQQRAKLLDFLINLTHDIVAFFVVLIFAQIWFKVTMNLDILPEIVFNVITVSMFTEVILTVRGITKALWDEKDILASPLIDKIRSKQD